MHLLHSVAILHLLSWLQLLFSGFLALGDRQEMPPKDCSDQTCGIPGIAPQALPLLVSPHHHTAPRRVQRTQASYFHRVLIAPLLYTAMTQITLSYRQSYFLCLCHSFGSPHYSSEVTETSELYRKTLLFAARYLKCPNHPELGAPSL